MVYPVSLPRCVIARDIEGMDLLVDGNVVTEPTKTGAGPSIEGQTAPKRAKTAPRETRPNYALSSPMLARALARRYETFFKSEN